MCISELRQASGLITRGVYAGGEQRASNGTEEATELIFKLEKVGSGWGEELFPRLTVEQRPIKKRIRIRNRSSFPDEWQVCLASLPCAAAHYSRLQPHDVVVSASCVAEHE